MLRQAPQGLRTREISARASSLIVSSSALIKARRTRLRGESAPGSPSSCSSPCKGWAHSAGSAEERDSRAPGVPRQGSASSTGGRAPLRRTRRGRFGSGEESIQGPLSVTRCRAKQLLLLFAPLGLANPAPRAAYRADRHPEDVIDRTGAVRGVRAGLGLLLGRLQLGRGDTGTG